MPRTEHRARTVADALAEHRAGLHATLDSDWLSLSSAPRAAAVGWRLLELNASLPGGIRIACSGETVRLRADLPVCGDDPDDDDALARRARETCGFFRSATRILIADGADGIPVHAETTGAGADTSGQSLAEICQGTGWPFVERTPGLLTIDLDVPERFAQAHLTRAESGEVRLRTDLLRRADLCAQVRAGLSLFLLTAADSLRMARPSADRADGAYNVRLEVCWQGAPSAGELARALEALSVGYGNLSREVDALRDESIAQAYLKLRGFEKWDVQAA